MIHHSDRRNAGRQYPVEEIKKGGNDMRRDNGACLVCGKPLVYFKEAKELECSDCGKKFKTYASCGDGHYVCDGCHSIKGIQIIMEGCLKSQSRNPVTLMQQLMEHPYIYMHGPEHHVLVGASLIAAYHNSGGEVDLEKALGMMRERGREYPGGACGLWGCCGAAASTGMFMSIITGATPLTGKSWGLSNQMTSRALGAIAKLGGPRCCKRNSFTAVLEAVMFVKENLGIEMELPDQICCCFSDENQQCLKKHCPYYKG